MTFEKHRDGFKKHLLGLKPYLQDLYCKRVMDFFEYRVQHAQDSCISAVRQRDIERYLESRRSLENRKSLVARITALQHFFRYLTHVAGVIPADPTAEIRRPEQDNGPSLMFTRRQILKMFSVCDMTTEQGLRDAVLLILGAYAGLRVDEICQFNVEHVVEFEDAKSVDLIVEKKKRRRQPNRFSLG